MTKICLVSSSGGYYERDFTIRVRTLELRVPEHPMVFERYQRNEKALLASMIEMYVLLGVSTRKVSKSVKNCVVNQFLNPLFLV